MTVNNGSVNKSKLISITNENRKQTDGSDRLIMFRIIDLYSERPFCKKSEVGDAYIETGEEMLHEDGWIARFVRKRTADDPKISNNGPMTLEDLPSSIKNPERYLKFINNFDPTEKMTDPIVRVVNKVVPLT